MSLSEKESAATDQTSSAVPPLPTLSEVKIGGLPLPGIFDVEWVKSMKDTVKLRPDDIWIVTYPKCGTTWAQQIVRLILNKGKDDGLRLDDAIPWVEFFCSVPALGFNYRVDIDKISSPRAFKSHFPYEMMPCGLPSTTPGKYIYVLRNPRDAAVSKFHHDRSIPFYPLYEWNDYFEMFIKGELEFGDYFDHVLSWWPHKDDDNVLILKYEDMKKDLPSAVATIANFIGQDISKELVEEIAHKTAFENMRRDSSANYEWTNQFRRPGASNFMRKRVVGDWKNYFTPEQIARLDALCEEKLKQNGIDVEFQ